MLNWIHFQKNSPAKLETENGESGDCGINNDNKSNSISYRSGIINNIGNSMIGSNVMKEGDNLKSEEYEKVRRKFLQACDEIDKNIIRLINSVLVNGEDNMKKLEKREERDRVFEKMISYRKDFINIFNTEKKELNLRGQLDEIKSIFLDLVDKQEKELNSWLNDRNQKIMEWNERVESIYKQIFTLSEIFCDSLLLNITCLLGYVSMEEHSLWVSIISLLIVFEIRSCQHTALLKENELIDEINQESFVILEWLNKNCDEFFSLLLKQYSVIPITYKIGEVLRDISTILNLAQGPGIVDKQNNKTFPISESFKNKSNEITQHLIYKQEIFTNLIKLSGNQCFDISSDAISTLRCYLFVSPKMTNEYILKNQQTFFSNIFKILIQSTEYVPQRHGLRLLNQLLSLKELSKVMTVFSSNCEYLKVFMNLITSHLNTISFEAFHIFKLFVANPNKSPGIQKALYKNKDKIVEFLIYFQTSRTDPQFISDKQVSHLNVIYIFSQ
ncbi:MO25-family [Cryptosporidium sp. chipmunk genotype I]|uniref:MO25-family n=1 Tax=Cryptosporidium sp. chipmunk genotype I TaxID=1280935 RepID=UPI003519D8B7|nr:MO25-family [Cryptosporidium sp. chipmunk genotype I]